VSAPLTSLRLELAPEATAVATLGAQLRSLLRRHYGTNEACDAIEIAAVEMLANVVRHGKGASRIAIRCMLHAEVVDFEMEDDGPPFDMAAATPSQLPAVLAENGRGLWLTRQVVGPLQYRRRGTRNVHRFSRRLRA